MVVIQNKICTKCKKESSVLNFSADNRSKSGFQSSCKKCQSKYWNENTDKYRALRNGDSVMYSKQKEYFNKNKDAINEYKRERYASIEGNAKVKAEHQERRCRKKTTSDATVTAKFILSLLRLQKYKCAITGDCLLKNNYHIDHIIPISKGGHHTSINVQLVTPKANLQKGNKLL